MTSKYLIGLGVMVGLATTLYCASARAECTYAATCPTTSGVAGHYCCPEWTLEGEIMVKPYDGADGGYLHITARTITIGPNAVINATAAGHVSQQSDGGGPGKGYTPPDTVDPALALPGGGGSHCGTGSSGRHGSDHANPCAVDPSAVGGEPLAYCGALGAAWLSDALTTPWELLGSTGGASQAGTPQDGHFHWGAKGGGVVILSAHTLTIRGKISADGQPRPDESTTLGAGPGGGAGGAIILIASDLDVTDNAMLSAAGSQGTSANSYGGSGGGGLIVFAPSSNTLASQYTNVLGGEVIPECTPNAPGEAGIVKGVALPDCVDADADGECENNCADDFNPTVGPSEDTCDGIDNDCSGVVDDGDIVCPAGNVCQDGVCVPSGTEPQIALHGGLCASAAVGGWRPNGRHAALALLAALGAICARRRRRRR